MRAEIRKLHDRLGATFVYVTHDQIEAMTMADHVVVMRDGVIEQQGAPLELYDRPANRFVAGFIGSPAMNFVEGVVNADGRSATLELDGRPAVPFAGRRPAGEEVVVGLRPEHLVVGSPEEAGAIRLGVSVIERTGSTSYIVTDTMPDLTISAAGRVEPDARAISVRVEPNHVHLFSRETGQALI